jgi:D-alanyl-D-alanine carboxypeptidase
VKIGNTDDAGKTMIAAAKRDGKTKLVVVLGAPGILERDLWTASLLDVGFSEDKISPVNVTEKQLRAKYSTWK